MLISFCLERQVKAGRGSEPARSEAYLAQRREAAETMRGLRQLLAAL